MNEHLSRAVLEQVVKAVAVLRESGIVAYPTDTVYGLGADIYNEEAVNKVFSAKDRPPGLALPVLVADAGQLDGLVSGQNSLSRALIARFWPGGLTLVFAKAPGVKSIALAGSSKIAVRMPDHPVALTLMKELGRPVVGTSANLHNSRTTLTAAEVRAQLGSRVNYIIDAGRCPGGESTIADITVDPPVILRQGIIAEKDIMAVYKETKGGN